MGLDIVILGSVIYLTANWKRRVLVMSVRESITGRKLEVFPLFQLGKNHGCLTAACICWLSSEQPCKNWIWYDSTLERPQNKEVPTAKQSGTIDQHKIATFATRHKLLLTPDIRWYLRPLWRHHRLWIPMDQPMDHPCLRTVLVSNRKVICEWIAMAYVPLLS